MKYKLVLRKNPQSPTTPGKWYAAPVNEGTISQAEISEDIVNLTSLARGDVSNVIISLLDTIPKYLLMGKSVKLNELGTFRVSFGSEGVEVADTFSTEMIDGVRIVFTPSPQMKTRLGTIRFSKEK